MANEPLEEKRNPQHDLDVLTLYFARLLAGSVEAGPIELHAMATAQEAARAIRMRRTDFYWMAGRIPDDTLEYVRGLALRVPSRILEVLEGAARPFDPRIVIPESEQLYRLRQRNRALERKIRALQRREKLNE